MGGVAVSLSIRGQKEMALLARDLDAAARKLYPILLDTAEAGVKPLAVDVPKAARALLPKRGGLADRVADSFSKIQRTNTEVKFLMQPKKVRGLRLIDRGKVRHPVYANAAKTRDEWKWVTQSVTPGFWTLPTKLAAARIHQDLDRELQRFADKIGG
jgi:hypothetical protein